MYTHTHRCTYIYIYTIIYNVYVYTHSGVLISHTAMVKSICWSTDDLR